MPKAGMAMEEGKVLKWLKKEGDSVVSGEPVAEIETDKISMELEAPATGILLKIVKYEGEMVPVTKAIGYIGKEGETIPEAADDGAAEAKEAPARTEVPPQGAGQVNGIPGKVAATPLAKTLAREKGIDLASVRGTGSHGEIKAKDVEGLKQVAATPLAKRVAEDQKIDLESVTGSGYEGKVRKEDLSVQKAGQQPASAPQAAAWGRKREAVRKRMSGMRKVIASRMLQSHLSIPPVTINAKADVTELSAVRKRLNDAIDTKISFNDFILKAVAAALSEFPYMNAGIEGDEVVFKPEINIGMAVALDDGLIVPVIRNADSLALKQISLKSKELSAKARERRLMPEEYSGGTFTVSNMGMFGVTSFNPIINLPEAAILGVCAIEEVLKLEGEKIEKKQVMGLSLTFDHRLVDGAQAAIFLKRVIGLLENPLELMV